MTGEVRGRAHEEEMVLKIFPALTNNVTTNCASSSSIPIAVGMVGITKKPCTRFMAELASPLRQARKGP
eukprot:9005939-Prorocentrum_lima.AAC.1